MKLVDHHLDWNEVKDKLEELDKQIFEGIDKTKLSNYEKRKLIFMYLCNNTTYDFDGYIDLILYSLNGKYNFDEISKKDYLKQFKIISDELKKNGFNADSNLVFQIMRRIKAGGYKRNFTGTDSLIRLFEEKKGLCNSDSQVYKMLLEMNGIYSALFFCENGEERLHVLNLVYDGDNDSYSFDDISTYTAAKATLKVNPEDFFDYDLEYANKALNQGNMSEKSDNIEFFSKNNMCFRINECFRLYHSSDVYSLFGNRHNDWYKKFDLEQDYDNIPLPDNIVSLKNKSIRL